MSDVVVNIRAEDNFSGVLGNFGSIITGIESAIHLAGDAFRVFSGFAMEGLEAIGSYERLGSTLQTLVAGQMLSAGAADSMSEAMGSAALKAEQLLEWVQELAIKSPFTSEGVADAFRMAMAYGFTAEEAQRLTQALIDFAAGSGATEDSMSRIALALGQIEAKGKLSGQEVLQLVNAGLAVDQILADAFGKSTAEIVKMREEGLIPANEAIEAITVYLETNFAGAAEKQSLTWAGLLATFQDLKAIGLREFFTGMAESLQPLAAAFAEWMQDEGMAKLREWGAILGEFTQNIVDKIPDVIARLEELRAAFEAGGIGGVIASFFEGVEIQDIVTWLDEVDALIADAVGSVNWAASGDAFGEMLLDAFTGGIESKQSQAGPAIGNALKQWIVSAFTVLEVAGTDAVRDFFNGIEVSITDGFRNALNGVELGITGWVYDKIINPIKAALGIASPSTVFAGIGRDIVLGLIAGFGSAIGGFISLVSGFIDYILGIFAPFLEILGIDIGGGSGGVGDHDPGRTTPGTPSTGASGTTVNQYFAGATINVGSWDEIIYDCVYPNPFIGSTSGQLTGGGGGTGAPR
jgi:tape measure domain-containing protein